MSNKRFGSLQGLGMRATRLSACGVPVSGAHNQATSDGFISVDVKANIDDGQVFEVKTAAGKFCVNQKDCPALKWFDNTIKFCNVDPEFFEVITPNLDLVTDVRGDTVGYQISDERLCANFALEVWTRVAGNACGLLDCAPSGPEQWIYWLFPWLTNGILGDYSIQNGPLEVDWVGNTRSNPSWGQGPYNVVCLDDVDDGTCTTPGPLADTPVLPHSHIYKRLTSIAPPTIACGTQTLTPVSPVDLGS